MRIPDETHQTNLKYPWLMHSSKARSFREHSCPKLSGSSLKRFLPSRNLNKGLKGLCTPVNLRFWSLKSLVKVIHCTTMHDPHKNHKTILDHTVLQVMKRSFCSLVFWCYLSISAWISFLFPLGSPNCCSFVRPGTEAMRSVSNAGGDIHVSTQYIFPSTTPQ